MYLCATRCTTSPWCRARTRSPREWNGTLPRFNRQQAVEPGELLEQIGRPQRHRFLADRRRDLQPNWAAVLVEPARHRHGRATRHRYSRVERRRPHIVGELLAAD